MLKEPECTEEYEQYYSSQPYESDEAEIPYHYQPEEEAYTSPVDESSSYDASYQQEASASQGWQDSWSQIREKLQLEDGKNKWVALILCLCLGMFGAHRFYVGKIRTGILFLFTNGLMGIGIIIDLIFILTDRFQDSDGNFLQG